MRVHRHSALLIDEFESSLPSRQSPRTAQGSPLRLIRLFHEFWLRSGPKTGFCLWPAYYDHGRVCACCNPATLSDNTLKPFKARHLRPKPLLSEPPRPRPTVLVQHAHKASSRSPQKTATRLLHCHTRPQTWMPDGER